MPKFTKNADIVEESNDRTLSFVITTDSVDRDKDIIKSDGWKLENYLKNPIVLFGHKWSDLPIGKCTAIQKIGNGLKATVEFASKELNPLGEQVYNMCKNGFLKATSVGFSVVKSSYDSERRGYDILEAELLEFSIVPIPANPDAMMLAAEKGLDTSYLEDLAEEKFKETKSLLESYFVMKSKNNNLELENEIKTLKEDLESAKDNDNSELENEIKTLKEELESAKETINTLQEYKKSRELQDFKDELKNSFKK